MRQCTGHVGHTREFSTGEGLPAPASDCGTHIIGSCRWEVRRQTALFNGRSALKVAQGKEDDLVYKKRNAISRDWVCAVPLRGKTMAIAGHNETHATARAQEWEEAQKSRSSENMRSPSMYKSADIVGERRLPPPCGLLLVTPH